MGMEGKLRQVSAFVPNHDKEELLYYFGWL
jgi:hypothetical protein